MCRFIGGMLTTYAKPINHEEEEEKLVRSENYSKGGENMVQLEMVSLSVLSEHNVQTGP